MVERIRLRLSPRARLLNQLAATAASTEALAANLSRHAARCTPPTLKAGLERLAADETAQADAMRELLLANGVWPKLPQPPLRDGASNWERLHGDLTVAIEALRALRFQLPAWVGVDVQIAERLRQFAAEAERILDQLRSLTLRCDPQALD